MKLRFEKDFLIIFLLDIKFYVLGCIENFTKIKFIIHYKMFNTYKCKKFKIKFFRKMWLHSLELEHFLN